MLPHIALPFDCLLPRTSSQLIENEDQKPETVVCSKNMKMTINSHETLYNAFYRNISSVI